MIYKIKTIITLKILKNIQLEPVKEVVSLTKALMSQGLETIKILFTIKHHLQDLVLDQVKDLLWERPITLQDRALMSTRTLQDQKVNKIQCIQN